MPSPGRILLTGTRLSGKKRLWMVIIYYNNPIEFSMVGSIKDLFLHPDTFFAQVSREKAGFFWPFIVVFLGSVISFIGAVVLSPPVTDPVTQYSITFLSQFVGALVTWIIISPACISSPGRFRALDRSS
jgi:hypothetical protein